MDAFILILLLFILACAISVACTKNLLTAVVMFMGQSLVMSIIWIVLESPDLAITEAAVGAGIDSLLLFVALKKIHAMDHAEEQNKPALSAEGGAANGEDA